MVKAAIVSKWQFTSANNGKFGKYIDYIDRKEAVRAANFHQYNLIDSDAYNQYMEDPEKSSGLFTKHKNHLTQSERKAIKDQFEVARKNDSLMWQDVVSFDTRWLVEQEMFNEQTGVLNEAKIMNAVRVAMTEMLRREELEQSAVWTGAIHYNEQHHIHVHLAIVEPHPTREYKTFTRKDGTTYQARRGFRAKKSVDRFRSQIASQLLDRDEPLAKISEFVRTSIGKEKGKMRQLPDAQLMTLYERIYKGLPPDRRLWKYNNNAMTQVRPLINQFVAVYLDTYEKEEYQELQTLLKENAAFYQTVYGEGTKEYQRANDFITNKNQELVARLGNSLLNEMSQQAQQERQSNGSEKSVNTYAGLSNIPPNASQKGNLNKVKKAFSQDFESVKNQQVYMQNLRKRQQEEQGFSR